MPSITRIPGFDPVKKEYLPLDKDAWLKAHEIERKGRQQGNINRPTTESIELDSTESDIVAWIGERARTCREDVTNCLLDLKRSLTDTDDEHDLQALEQRVEETKREAESRLTQEIERRRNAMSLREASVKDERIALDEFKRTANLRRPADYSHRKTAWIWLVSFAVFEIILNATLLMDVNAFGLLGSISQMAFISGLNVGAFGLLVGVLIRWKNHASQFVRVMSWSGVALSILFVLVFNLLVGHFRDSMQAVVSNYDVDIATLGGDTIDRLLAGPIDLGSFQSLLLVLVGCVCFAISAWKWWQRDDPYPRYGHRARQVAKAEQDFIKAFEETQKTLERALEDKFSSLEDIRHKLEIARGHWKEVCEVGNHLVKEYPHHLRQYQFDLNHLLQAYRTANQESRSTQPPARFDRTEQVDPELLEPPTFDPPPESRIERVRDKVHEAFTELQDRLRDALASFRGLSALGGQDGQEAAADA